MTEKIEKQIFYKKNYIKGKIMYIKYEEIRRLIGEKTQEILIKRIEVLSLHFVMQLSFHRGIDNYSVGTFRGN